jgi:hypothetical protein
MKAFLSAFRELPKGIYRLILVGSILLPMIIGIIQESNVQYSDGEYFFGSFFFGFIIYWILARVGVWIYQGFKEDKK